MQMPLRLFTVAATFLEIMRLSAAVNTPTLQEPMQPHYHVKLIVEVDV